LPKNLPSPPTSRKALGGFTKHDDYFESETHVLSSAVGHLLELACPEEFEVKRGKWSFAHLPVIPPHFALSPIEKTESRLKLLNKLIKRKDVAGLINACDAGREGELIFNYIAQHSQVGQAGAAPVAAVDDPGRHPRRLRPPAPRPTKCRAWAMPPSAVPNPTGWSASTARGR
jgi:hypothetical protein